MINLGYTKEEVIKMTIVYPALLSISTQNIIKKIEFYKSIGIEKTFVTNPKNLIQGVDLSYARYYFYMSKNIEITESNIAVITLKFRQIAMLKTNGNKLVR